MSAETVINEFGHKVRVIEWDELQRRIAMRKYYTGTQDLNGYTLVIRHTWGIGDILYSTPAVKALKEKFPECKIIYISSYPDVLKGNPYVDEAKHWMEIEDLLDLGDKLIEGEKGWYYLDYNTPLKGGYDYKIHLRTKPQLNEYLLSLLKKDPATLQRQEREFFNQASNAVISRYKQVALDIYCWHAYVDPPDKTVYYYPTQDELTYAKKFFAGVRKEGYKPVILMPHTSTLFKDYPHWKEVVKLCPFNYFWFIMGARKDSGDNWIGTNTFDCSGAFQLRQSFALCIEADMACASDTGMFYPRAALGKPCVVTYGPHEPEPFLHYFPSARGLRIKKLEKTPGMIGMCSVGCYIDTEACKDPGSYSPCLMELDPKLVAQTIMEAMENGG